MGETREEGETEVRRTLLASLAAGETELRSGLGRKRAEKAKEGGGSWNWLVWGGLGLVDADGEEEADEEVSRRG